MVLICHFKIKSFEKKLSQIQIFEYSFTNEYLIYMSLLSLQAITFSYLIKAALKQRDELNLF